MLGDLAGDGTAALLRLDAELVCLLGCEAVAGRLLCAQVGDERRETGKLFARLRGAGRVDLGDRRLDPVVDDLQSGDDVAMSESLETTLNESPVAASPRTNRDSFHWPKYSLIVGTITTSAVKASDGLGCQACALVESSPA